MLVVIVEGLDLGWLVELVRQLARAAWLDWTGLDWRLGNPNAVIGWPLGAGGVRELGGRTLK